jgi:hypothetical protein
MLPGALMSRREESEVLYTSFKWHRSNWSDDDMMPSELLLAGDRAADDSLATPVEVRLRHCTGNLFAPPWHVRDANSLLALLLAYHVSNKAVLLEYRRTIAVGAEMTVSFLRELNAQQFGEVPPAFAPHRWNAIKPSTFQTVMFRPPARFLL